MSGANLGDALSDMWRSVLLFVPTALAFLAILLIGYVLARLVRSVLVKALRRIGFDRAVERGAVGRALGGRVEPSDLCAKIAFYGVLLFALQLAFGIWGPNAVSDLLAALIGWLPRAFVAIVIIVVAAAVGGAVRDLTDSALGGLAYGRVLARAAYWLIVALGVIAALDQVRIATAVTQPVLIAVLATVAGVIIVGVGGGLIRPMQQRWEIWLDRAGAESAAIREHARSYADERARAAAERKAAETPAAEAGADEPGTAETPALEPRAPEPRAPEPRTPEPRAPEDGAGRAEHKAAPDLAEENARRAGVAGQADVGRQAGVAGQADVGRQAGVGGQAEVGRRAGMAGQADVGRQAGEARIAAPGRVAAGSEVVLPEAEAVLPAAELAAREAERELAARAAERERPARAAERERALEAVAQEKTQVIPLQGAHGPGAAGPV